MQEVILALLRLVRSRVVDRETNTWVIDLATDRTRWQEAHALFRQIRSRSLDAGDRRRGRSLQADDGTDLLRCSQYVFEHICLKSIYNETDTARPFDPSSSSYVAEFAVRLARAIGVPVQDVLAIVAAQANPETALYRRVFPAVSGPVATASSVSGVGATTEEVAKEFPDLQQFPMSYPGPYEKTMGDKIAGLLGLFQGRVPDATSHTIVLQLAITPDRWSAGHALFDILHNRLLVSMRARDQVRYLQHEFEQSCLQALYNATSPVHPFPRGAPFWVAGAALNLARAVGVPDQAVVAILAPDQAGE